jgi:hypothetical protein
MGTRKNIEDPEMEPESTGKERAPTRSLVRPGRLQAQLSCAENVITDCIACLCNARDCSRVPLASSFRHFRAENGSLLARPVLIRHSSASVLTKNLPYTSAQPQVSLRRGPKTVLGGLEPSLCYF